MKLTKELLQLKLEDKAPDVNLTDDQKQQLIDHFKEWSGGVAPDKCPIEKIAKYVENDLLKDMPGPAAKKYLQGHKSKVAEENGIYEPLTNKQLGTINKSLKKRGDKLERGPAGSYKKTVVAPVDESVTESDALADVHQDLEAGVNAGASDKKQAHELEVGDSVEITGEVNFKGEIGKIERFGKDKKIVVVKLDDGGSHPFHSRDVSEIPGSKEEEDEGPKNKFYVAFYDEHEEKPWIGIVTKENGGKWHEKSFKGHPDSRWGMSYMSYLTPDDIMNWIHKDYGRHIEIEGPFFSSDDAEDHVRHNFGTIAEGSKPSGKALSAKHDLDVLGSYGVKGEKALTLARQYLAQGCSHEEAAKKAKKKVNEDLNEAFAIKLSTGKYVTGAAMNWGVGPIHTTEPVLTFKSRAKADDWLVMQGNSKSGKRLVDAEIVTYKPKKVEESYKLIDTLSRKMYKEPFDVISFDQAKKLIDMDAADEATREIHKDNKKRFWGLHKDDQAFVLRKHPNVIKQIEESLSESLDKAEKKTVTEGAHDIVDEIMGYEEKFAKLDRRDMDRLHGLYDTFCNQFDPQEKHDGFRACFEQMPEAMLKKVLAKVEALYKGLTESLYIEEGWKKENPKSQEKTNRDRAGRKVKTPDGPGTIQYEVKRPTFGRLVPYAHEVLVKLDDGKTTFFPIRQIKLEKTEAVKESEALMNNPASFKLGDKVHFDLYAEHGLSTPTAKIIKSNPDVSFDLEAAGKKFKNIHTDFLSRPNKVKMKEETYTDFDDWKKAVLASYPAQARRIKFTGRMEGGKTITSAEIPGEDRCYGVWDLKKENGKVLSEGDEWSMTKRQFKRDELDHELAHETNQRSHKVDNSKCHMKIDGKIWNRGGKPIVFTKDGANLAAKSLSAKGKKIELVPITEEKVTKLGTSWDQNGCTHATKVKMDYDNPAKAPHKVMTSDEYLKSRNNIGPHDFDPNVDGDGNVGIRYTGSASKGK